MEEARYLEVTNVKWGHTREESEQHHMLHPHECSERTPSPPAHCHTPAAPTKPTGIVTHPSWSVHFGFPTGDCAAPFQIQVRYLFVIRKRSLQKDVMDSHA